MDSVHLGGLAGFHLFFSIFVVKNSAACCASLALKLMETLTGPPNSRVNKIALLAVVLTKYS